LASAALAILLILCAPEERANNRANISVKFLVFGLCGNLGRKAEKAQEVEVRASNPGAAVSPARSAAALGGFRDLSIILLAVLLEFQQGCVAS
jgi:hypothetical protein